MSDQQAAMSADQEPTTSDQQADHQAVGLSIADAARRLGVSENAIRQRIKRGTITAAKIDGVWQVFVADHEGDHEGDHQATTSATTTPPGRDHEGDYQAAQEPIEARYRVTPAEIEQAIERTGDKYVTDMRAMFERLDELYRDRLADKDRLIVALERERDALQARLSALEAEQAESLEQPSSAPQAATDAATRPLWWQFWKR